MNETNNIDTQVLTSQAHEVVNLLSEILSTSTPAVDVKKVADHINLDELAQCMEVDHSQIEVDHYDIARYLEVSGIAEHIDVEDVAGHMSIRDVADHIDCEEVASHTSTQCIANCIDLESVAIGVAEILQDSVKFDERSVSELAAEDMMSNGTFVDQLATRMLQLAGWQSESDRKAHRDHQLDQQKRINELKAVNVELQRHLQEANDKQVH